ncbi:hypothetical protein V8D89_000587, partial [Ganoderma adspersum]
MSAQRSATGTGWTTYLMRGVREGEQRMGVEGEGESESEGGGSTWRREGHAARGPPSRIPYTHSPSRTGVEPPPWPPPRTDRRSRPRPRPTSPVVAWARRGTVSGHGSGPESESSGPQPSVKLQELPVDRTDSRRRRGPRRGCCCCCCCSWSVAAEEEEITATTDAVPPRAATRRRQYLDRALGPGARRWHGSGRRASATHPRRRLPCVEGSLTLARRPPPKERRANVRPSSQSRRRPSGRDEAWPSRTRECAAMLISGVAGDVRAGMKGKTRHRARGAWGRSAAWGLGPHERPSGQRNSGTERRPPTV